jgi:hypothetical protein
VVVVFLVGILGCGYRVAGSADIRRVVGVVGSEEHREELIL